MEPCDQCGGVDLSVEFHDDYRAHLHPECLEAYEADRLSSQVDQQEDARGD